MLYPSQVKIAIAASDDEATGFGKGPAPYDWNIGASGGRGDVDADATSQQAGRLVTLIEMYAIHRIKPPPMDRFLLGHKDAINFVNETDRYLQSIRHPSDGELNEGNCCVKLRMLGYTAKRKSVYNRGLTDRHISLGCRLSTDARPVSPLGRVGPTGSFAQRFHGAGGRGCRIFVCRPWAAAGGSIRGCFACRCRPVLVGGMILNDVFDVQQDTEERPSRPIPAGHIGLR